MNVLRYRLVTASDPDVLDHRVNDMITRGWTPWGPPFYTGRGHEKLGQAVVLSDHVAVPSRVETDRLTDDDLMHGGTYGTA